MTAVPVRSVAALPEELSRRNLYRIFAPITGSPH
jgi:hypothetical protein